MRRSKAVLITIVVSALALMNCTPTSPTPPEPPDTLMSITTRITTSNSLPDTIYYGTNLAWQICLADTDGDSISLRVSGLPAQRYTISHNGDSTFLLIDLHADSLFYDSLYSIAINASGLDSVDTLTIIHSLMVLDTNRLGGVRKLTPGMWWVTERTENSIIVRDSGNVEITTRDTSTHHLKSAVVGSVLFNGVSLWQIENTDTLVATGAVSRDTVYIQHTAQSIRQLILSDDLMRDTLWMTLYSLPLRTGKTWNIITATADTALRQLWGNLSVPIDYNYTWQGDALDSAASTILFGNHTQTTHIVSAHAGIDLFAACDTTLRFPSDTINSGDTVITWSLYSTGQNAVCNDLGISLWNNDVQVGTERNLITNVVQTTTVSRSNTVVKTFDPRTGILLSQ